MLLAAAGRRTRIWDPLTGQPVGDPLLDEHGKARAITSSLSRPNTPNSSPRSRESACSMNSRNAEERAACPDRRKSA